MRLPYDYTSDVADGSYINSWFRREQIAENNGIVIFLAVPFLCNDAFKNNMGLILPFFLSSFLAIFTCFFMLFLYYIHFMGYSLVQ